MVLHRKVLLCSKSVYSNNTNISNIFNIFYPSYSKALRECICFVKLTLLELCTYLKQKEISSLLYKCFTFYCIPKCIHKYRLSFILRLSVYDSL